MEIDCLAFALEKNKKKLIRNLMEAYEKVKANRGAAGVDGVCITDFDKKRVAELRCLEKELMTKTYRPQAVKRVYIPKPDGSKRPLGIPTVRDRVVQQALLNVLQPMTRASTHRATVQLPKQSGSLTLMDLSKCFDITTAVFCSEALIRQMLERNGGRRFYLLLRR